MTEPQAMATDGTVSEFERDTAVEPLGDGRYAVDVSENWRIVSGPNGGYIAALLVRALEHAVSDPDRPIRTITFHFLRAPKVAPSEIVTENVRTGRSVSVWRAQLEHEGTVSVIAIATFGLNNADAPLRFDDTTAPPNMTAPEYLTPLPSYGGNVPIAGRYEMRPTFGMAFVPTAEVATDRPEFAPFVPPSEPPEDRSRTARTGGWMRLADPSPVTAPLLAAMCDAWFPPVFTVMRQPFAVPTVELTMHFRGLPEDPNDWIFGEFSSLVAEDGYLVEDASLWDRHGRLLLQSRQLAMVINI